MTTLRLARNSRYVGTPFYQLEDSSTGRPVNTFFFGVWKRPAIETTVSDQMHTVTDADIGRIDLIAYKYYNDALLWWVIADVNSIVFPETDMTVGQKLAIPNLSAIKDALDKAITLR